VLGWPRGFGGGYFWNVWGVWQLGKKAFAAILLICPRVAVLFGRKYGRLFGAMHGSPVLPHG
jgi:hypothetical protein